MSVPALRFKEFDGDWKSFSLLDLSSDKTLNNGVFNDQNKVGKGLNRTGFVGDSIF